MSKPCCIATWSVAACRVAYPLLVNGTPALDAIIQGVKVVEDDPKFTSVGYGGLPNREGVVELDAAVIDGRTQAAGAVAGLRDIAHPAEVARRVMEQTRHTMLVGEGARRFAIDQGFIPSNLLSPEARNAWEARRNAPPENHDTIGMLGLDQEGYLGAVCTTSGMAWKVPGRVGDTPLIGAGLYLDQRVGAAAATGNGDEIMRGAVSARTVWLMESGASPQKACIEALRYLYRLRPYEYMAAVIALDTSGRYGAAIIGPDTSFPYGIGIDDDVREEQGQHIDIAG